MDLFRKNQKIIFWIVAIIIIPSFVLVWGVGDLFSSRDSNSNFEIGVVGGDSLHYSEFDAFQKRIRAAVGGAPLQFAGAPGADTNTEELWKFLLTYAVLQDAEKAGCRASDLQVGTYIESGHPALAEHRLSGDPKALDRAVDMLCRQMMITRREFLHGVREWQTIGNYIFTDADLTPVTDDNVFSFYTYTRSECVVKRVRIFETDVIKEQAKKDVMEKPADVMDREVRAYVEGKRDDPKYREPSSWRFAYVLVPFVAESSVAQPTEDEISHYYELTKNYLYQGKTLTEVHDVIKANLLNEEVERQTRRNATIDVDSQLRRQGAELELSELVKLTQLAKYGVTAAVTGEETLPVDDALKQLPAGADFAVRRRLQQIDELPPEVRSQVIVRWKDGFDLDDGPFRSDAGFFRLRLLDYAPSAPAAIDDETGAIRAEILELAVLDMIADRTAELVAEKAEEMERRLREYLGAKERGEDIPDPQLAEEFEALPTETILYMNIPDNLYELGRLVVGDLMGPLPATEAETGKPGLELIALVGRRLPSRAAFDAEPEEVKLQYRSMAMGTMRGNFGINTRGAFIQPSPAMAGSLSDRMMRGVIRLNPVLSRGGNGEG